jgi:hypothetical protein
MATAYPPLDDNSLQWQNGSTAGGGIIDIKKINTTKIIY